MSDSMDAVECSTPVLLLQGVPDPLQQAGVAVARSLGRLGVAVHAVYAGAGAVGARSRYIRSRSAWSLAQAAGPATLRHLRERAREAGGMPLLIPTDDVATLFVAQYSDALREWFRFPAQPPGLPQQLAGKRTLQALCDAHGIDSARCEYPASRQDLLRILQDWQFPGVLKSIDPDLLRQRPGAKSVTIASTPAELVAAYDAMEVPGHPNLMLQEYIPGNADSVWMFNGCFDAQSDCIFGLTGQKLRQSPIRTGATSLGVCVSNPIVLETTRRFMKAIGYRGIVDLGYRYDARDGRYKLLDVNPRIGATFRLFVAGGGMDVARALYLNSTGQPVPAQGPADGRRWLVELRDLRSAHQLRRERQLTAWRWLRSYAGVRETAWFATDDLEPFFRMLGHYARRGARPRQPAASPRRFSFAAKVVRP